MITSVPFYLVLGLMLVGAITYLVVTKLMKEGLPNSTVNYGAYIIEHTDWLPEPRSRGRQDFDFGTVYLGGPENRVPVRIDLFAPFDGIPFYAHFRAWEDDTVVLSFKKDDNVELPRGTDHFVAGISWFTDEDPFLQFISERNGLTISPWLKEHKMSFAADRHGVYWAKERTRELMTEEEIQVAIDYTRHFFSWVKAYALWTGEPI